MSLAEKVSKSELEVMKILWRENKPVSFYDMMLDFSYHQKPNAKEGNHESDIISGR